MTESFNFAGAPATRKIAALLISLGSDAASHLLPRLPADTIDKVAAELLRMPNIESSQRDLILQETYEGVFTDVGVIAGGETFALEIFAEAFGEDRARELLERIHQQQVVLPFEFLRRLDPFQVKGFLEEEHPQTIALVLANLDARTAAKVLGELDHQLRVEVARRIALMEQTSPDTVAIVEDGLRRRMSSIVTESTAQVGGIKPLASVLNQVDRATERQILGQLAEADPELADSVRKLMFVFEDIAKIDDRGMQRVIRDLDSKDMALALRNAKDDVKKKFFGNMSQRAADMLREEMSLASSVRLKNVEEAQQRIVEVVKRLEESDEIVINRGGAGGGDDALV
jgi:flagellar motor switch protein FliG